MLCRTLPALFLLAGLSGQTQQAGTLGSIEGVVTGPGEKHVPLADVWAVVNGKEVARIKANGTGYFTFHRLPLGPVTVHGTGEGRTLGQASAILAQKQAHARVRIRVLAGGAIRGRILDPGGEPISGAHVVASSTASTRPSGDSPSHTPRTRSSTVISRMLALSLSRIRRSRTADAFSKKSGIGPHAASNASCSAA